MAFLNPLFLYAFFTLSIPVLIHLFNFRRYRKVYFTNVRFLTEITKETHRKSRIKQWILLVIRLLALSALVLAFARPYIPGALQTLHHESQQVISVYIDNSFSMETLSGSSKLIDLAKTKATEIANAYQPSDKFHLLTNDFEGGHQRFVNRDEFITMVHEVTISPAIRQLSAVISRQQDMMEQGNEKTKNLFMISDFQKSVSNLLSVHPDSSIRFFFLPLETHSTDNLYIDTLFFGSPVQQPDQLSRLHIVIKNSGSTDLEKIPVKLVINKVQKAVASIDVPAKSQTELVMPFRNNLSGIQYGVAEIMDYPVIYDDQMFFSYDLTSSIPVLCIHETENNPYLNALFMSDSIFQITNSYERQLDYSTLSTYPVIILDGLSHISSGLREELTKVIQQGGNLILFPSGQPEMDSYDSFFKTINSPAFGNPDTAFLRVDYIATESPVLADMFDRRSDGSVILPEHADLPGVFFHFPVIRKNQSGIEELLSLQNGQPFLFSLPVGKGLVYVFTTPLDVTKTNFPKHLLFVPVLFQIALNSQHLQPIYYYSGMDDPIIFGKDSTSEKSLYKIRKNDSDFEMIPEKCQKNGHFCLFPHGQIQESGLYHIDNEYITMYGLGFNYHRNESDLTFETIQTLEEMLEKIHMNHYEILKDTPASLTTEIIRLQHGTPLWKLFLIISLTFFAFEIIAILLFRRRS